MIFNNKSTLINLDISANPLLDLDQTIKALTEFTSLKKLKINIETGDEAKKIIDALPLLEILNDHPIHEEDNENEIHNENIEIISESHENKEANGIHNINNNLIEEEIAQLNYQSLNNSNEKNNNNKIINNNINFDNNAINQNINNLLENKVEISDENKFEFILNKIKEYSEITKEKYDLINNEYNRLVNNNIKNTLDICSFFNKVLINLIKDAQEQNNIKISSLKPLLEAQSQNEIIRINFEGKIHLALQNSNINNNHSYITIESLREKNKLIQTETNSINQDKNITNISSNNYNNLNQSLNSYNNIYNNVSNNYNNMAGNFNNLSKSVRVNNSNNLNITVNNNSNSSINNINGVTIYDCFDFDRKVNLMSGENQMYCNNCKCNTDCTICTNLVTGPEILIIILNRGQGIEFDVKINFEEELDLSNYIQFNNKSRMYQLIGVITHIGESSMSGHFIAYCKDPISGKWHKYNDAMVNEVENFQNEVINFAMPYLLFYQKV